MGIHTIIGAEAFHCPVRDGKEWDHLAMAAKLDCLLACVPREGRSQTMRIGKKYFGLLRACRRGPACSRIRERGLYHFARVITMTVASALLRTLKVIGSSRTGN